MHSKDTPDCLLFALFILILSPILCEIIDINDLKLHNNNVLNVFNFYWKATEFNTSKMNSFKYNLTIKNIDLPHKGVFHLFAISPQLFKYINVLYEPGFCCFDNYIGFCTPAGNQTNSQEIINQSSYYRNISLTSNNTWIMEDHLNTSIEGIHSTYIAFCSSETTKMQITLQGEMIYSTVTGYLSSENYFIIYLYVSIVVYLLIIALIWISLAIKNNKIQRIPCFKLYSLSILIIISNKLLHIILLLMQNQKGKLMLQISIINNLLNVIGNVIYRILIYAVSLGYTLNSHLKLYKEEEKIFTFFNQNKILKMNLLLVFYSVGFFLFETTVIYYTYFHLCVIYPVMNLTLMMISNFFFMTQSCKRINKKLNLASSTIIKNLFKKYNISLIVCLIFNSLYLISFALYTILSKYQFIIKLKWIGILLFEGDQLILFSVFPYLFLTTPNQKAQTITIELESGETQDFSESNNAKKEL